MVSNLIQCVQQVSGRNIREKILIRKLSNPLCYVVQASYITYCVGVCQYYIGFASAIYTRRVARQYSICWSKKALSIVRGTLHIFFRNKTFLFVKIESWKFQHLFDLRFSVTLLNFSSFRQTFRWHFPMGSKSFLNELTFG